MLTETINYKGFTLQVAFDYDKGFAGSQYEPPEPECVEIDKVKLNQRCGIVCHHIDITELLGESQFEEIEEILLNLHTEAEAEREIDRYEYLRDRDR